MSDNKSNKPTPTKDTTKPSDNSRIAPLTGQINESKNNRIQGGVTVTNTRPAPDPKSGNKGK